MAFLSSFFFTFNGGKIRTTFSAARIVSNLFCIKEFIKNLMANQLLTIRASENVVRILPPLNVKKNEIDQAIKVIHKVCKEY